MLKTIRARLTLWYVALLAMILVASSAALYFMLARSFYQEVDDTLTFNAQQLVDSLNIEDRRVTFSGSDGEPSDVDSVRAQGYLARLLDVAAQISDTDARAAALPNTSVCFANWAPKWTI